MSETTINGLVDPGSDVIEEYRSRGYVDDVLPIPPKERSWKTLQFITVWMGPIHNILSYFTVMTFFALGLNAWQVVGAILTAATIVSIGYVLNGQAAAKYGIPFAMLVREAFGHKGALIPTWIRGIIAGFMFFGITSVSSAQAFDVVFETLFPGFMQIGDGADILGLPIPTAISFAFTWIITVALFLTGQKFLGKFSTWANPVVYVLVVVAVVLAIINAGGLADTFAIRVVDSPVTPLIFITCVSMLVSNWAGPIVNTADYSRNAKTLKAPAIGFPVGVIGSYLLFALVAVSFVASLQVATNGDFDINRPGVFVEAINSIGNPFVVVILIIAMNVGAVAFVVFGNMLPAGLQLAAQLPKVFTVKRGALLTAVIGTVILPWQFVANTDMLFLFYSIIGSLFGPIAGIMLSSYFIDRGRKVNLAGIYANYRGGEQGALPAYDWRAITVLGLSFVITMIGRIPGVASIEVLAQINNLAFFSGVTIGFLGFTIASLLTRRNTHATITNN